MDHRKEKIKQFMADTVMSEVIQDEIRNSFLKTRKDQDIYKLAASRLAIDYLNEAFKEFGNIVRSDDNNDIIKQNVGL